MVLFFPKSPTNPDVVQASVDYCISVSYKLGQEHCIITWDQAIFEILLGLKNKYHEKYNCVIQKDGRVSYCDEFPGSNWSPNEEFRNRINFE